MLRTSIQFLTATVIAFATAVPIAASLPSTPDLKLSGTVQGVSTRCINEKPILELSVYLQFRNDSDKTLLLMTPTWMFTRRVIFTDSRSEGAVSRSTESGTFQYNPYLDNPFRQPTSEDYDPFPELVRRLDSPEPKLDIRAVESGSYYEFRDTLWLQSGFRIQSADGKLQKQCARATGIAVGAIPKYEKFSLEYKFSVKKHDGGTDLLEKLRDRWSKFGLLFLDSAGDIAYRSDEIALPYSTKTVRLQPRSK